MLASYLQLFKGKRALYLLSWLILVSGLPFSVISLSWAQFLLAIHWLIEPNYKEKFQRVLTNKPALILMGLFVIHIIGLLYTSDFAYGWKDIRVKLPMFTLPLLLASQPKFSKKEGHLILFFFSLAVLVASFITYSSVNMLGLISIPEARELSYFISHIRFSLMIALSIFIVLWLAIQQNKTSVWALFVVVLVWLGFYLIQLQALTGILITIVLFLFTFLYFNYKKKKRFYAMSVAVASAFIFSLLGIGYEAKSYFELREINQLEMQAYSVNGEVYEFKQDVQQYENGYRLWAFLARNELKREWEKRSQIGYYEKDKKGQPMFSTLMRYMTSKGLKKDSVGVSKLSEADIAAIESGLTNVNQLNGESFESRLYSTFWELEAYFKGYNPAGNSFTQRIEFWKTATRIIREHVWFGVGTGDVKQVFKDQYKIDQSELPVKYRKRSHNQFLSFWVGLGILGLGYYFFVLLAPFFIEKPSHYLYWVFFIIMVLCMLNEDTYERQIGATFISFFFAFFWFAWDKEPAST